MSESAVPVCTTIRCAGASRATTGQSTSRIASVVEERGSREREERGGDKERREREREGEEVSNQDDEGGKMEDSMSM